MVFLSFMHFLIPGNKYVLIQDIYKSMDELYLAHSKSENCMHFCYYNQNCRTIAGYSVDA